MLSYHFGSKKGLLVAVVRAVEQSQEDALAELTADLDSPPADLELYGQAVQGRPGTSTLLEGIVDSWVEPRAKYEHRAGLPLDVARARLGLAVARGLLFDLVATNDLDGLNAAMEQFIALTEPARASPRPTFERPRR